MVSVLLPLLVSALPAAAQIGFTPAGAAGEREFEAGAIAVIEPAELEGLARTLSAQPHVAGTPGQAAFRNTLVALLRGWGLSTQLARYAAFVPHATAVSVALVAPEARAFALEEPPLEGDPATAFPQYPWVNGYSAPGAAEGDVVYANYGLHEDYQRLDSLGVEVEGRVVVARYGLSYRGVKARLAGEHGAAALLLYSDPEDDGYTRGDLWPEGPFRPWQGIQRGSVFDGTGDPTTPEGPSLPGARRTAPWGVPPIPVVPVSYGVASEILARVRGAGLPSDEWQGALPFRYHVGPGPARVRVVVEDDRAGPSRGIKEIVDVVGRIEGSEWPDELVVLGAHIDAWGPGAADNVSGTASVWAVAHALARLAADGRRPRRTIVFAGWDGEEWGLIGSTEWVEEHAAGLARSAVAYLNQDAVGGTRFGAAASPSLKNLLREAAAAVPGDRGSLLDVWRAQGERDAPPPVGDLGGGSDFSPFYNHLGIPSASHGFGTPGGVYHSHYDTWRWMATFGDPGFAHHAQSAELLAVVALRLADAEVLPYDYAAFGEELARRWRVARDSAAAAGLLGAETPDPVAAALTELAAAGARLAAAREAYLAGAPDPVRSRAANAALRAVERELTRDGGLAGRPWYRNLAFAADRRNGYATLALPSVAEAIQARDRARLGVEIEDLAARLRAAAARVDQATAALQR